MVDWVGDEPNPPKAGFCPNIEEPVAFPKEDKEMGRIELSYD